MNKMRITFMIVSLLAYNALAQQGINDGVFENDPIIPEEIYDVVRTTLRDGSNSVNLERNDYQAKYYVRYHHDLHTALVWRSLHAPFGMLDRVFGATHACMHTYILISHAHLTLKTYTPSTVYVPGKMDARPSPCWLYRYCPI